MSTSSYFFIASIFAAVIACSGTSNSGAPQEGAGGETDTSTKLPERASSPASSSSSSSSTPSAPASASTDAGAGKDAALEASSTTKDAAADAKTDAAPTKLAYGAACTSHDQCAGNLCLAFDGKLRCTKACNDDDDCQNGDDCDGDINVCEID